MREWHRKQYALIFKVMEITIGSFVVIMGIMMLIERIIHG